jgi:hypothetical protein
MRYRPALLPASSAAAFLMLISKALESEGGFLYFNCITLNNINSRGAKVCNSPRKYKELPKSSRNWPFE